MLSKKEKIILNIGDDGAILTHMRGKEMVKRMFASSPLVPELKSYCKAHAEAELSLFVDVVDQAFIHQTFPPISKIYVKKQVARKLAREFDERDIKAALPMGQRKEGKKEWEYIFVSVRNTSPFSDWVAMASELPNPLDGIYLLPVETMAMLPTLREIGEVDTSGGQTKEWALLVSHNRVGGFRQIVYHRGRVVFTRVAQPIGGQTPDMIAGNIEQETLNTLEYIRRLDYQDEWGIDIFIITSSEVKEFLEVNNFVNSSPVVVTPYQLAQKSGIPTSATESDRFGDVVAAAFFAVHGKRHLRLETPYIRKLSLLQLSRKAVKIAGVLVGLGLVLTGVYLFADTYNMKDQLLVKQQEIAEQKSRMSSLNKIGEGLNYNPDFIREIVSVDKLLTIHESAMFDFYSRITKVVTSQITVKDARFSYEEKAPQKSSLPPGKPVIVGTFDFVAEGTAEEGLAGIVEEIDLFVAATRKAFSEGDVEFRDLPNQDALSLSNSAAPITGKRYEFSASIILLTEEVK